MWGRVMLQARFFYRLLRWRVMGIRRGFEKLFVVYPGGDSDYAAYLPRASARWLP